MDMCPVWTIEKWWAQQDSNLRPRDYESPASATWLEANRRFPTSITPE